MPRSVPAPTSPLLSTNESPEDTFPVAMEMGAGILGVDAVGARDSPDSMTGRNVGGSVDEAEKPSSTVASPALSGTSSPSCGGSDSPANRNSQDLTARQEREGSDTVEKVATLERRNSYRMATEEEDELGTLESAKPNTDASARAKVEQRPKKDALANFKGKIPDSIKRSTSSVETSSQAAIKLRTNLNSNKSPRAVSSVSGIFSPSSLERVSTYSSGKDSAFSSLKSCYMSPRSSLDHLIDREINTGSYVAPLIGCIPPSALKCFAGKEAKKETCQSPMTSPSHSQSGKEDQWEGVKDFTCFYVCDESEGSDIIRISCRC